MANKANPCIECMHACDQTCPWVLTRDPVPGWGATLVERPDYSAFHTKPGMHTPINYYYRISYCPNFERPEKKDTLEQWKHMVEEHILGEKIYSHGWKELVDEYKGLAKNSVQKR